jgi:predicted Ser/Thr protein kinase
VADNTCPSCGKALPAGAPQGLCPECLIKSGFKTGTAPDGSGAARGFTAPAVEELRPLFPQLEILELIGRGGMGAVYKARQPALDRLVALKILPSTIAGDPGFADRFNREARALARLQHPRIVMVHDFGIAGGLHYLVMEYVDGPNLRAVQRSGRLAPEQALRIVPEICDALQFAHDRGIVHRDIKPENLLLDREGHIKITDFGIAKMVGPDAETAALTGTVGVVGTPHYMAPEQIERPADVDHRADIYSLGVVFYELLTGELPIGRFAIPSSRVQLDVRLDEVILRSLEKEPARRYQQVSQVKSQLDTIAQSPGKAPAVTRQQPIVALPAMILYVLQALLAVPIGALWIRMLSPMGAMGAQFPPAADPGFFPMWFPFIWMWLFTFVLIGAYLAWGVLQYQCWTALPERYRATTPAQAAGFIFIPLFNFYWIFITLRRLADGFNAFREEHPGRPIRDARGLATAKAISFVCGWTIGWIPGLGSIVAIVDAILFVLYYRAIVSNANQVIAGDAK